MNDNIDLVDASKTQEAPTLPKINMHLLFKLTFISILAFLIYGAISYAWKDYQLQQEEMKREATYAQILDGASTKPVSLTIDFKNPTSEGSPLIFGGSHHPSITHQDAWDKLQEVGVTSIRTDLAMNYMIRNTTLENYKNNVGNIQHINNWNQTDLKAFKNKLAEAKKRDMKVIGIIDYTPPWLAADGTDFGVPKDWDVFEDIVKKTYAYHRENLDYVELWNEPNHKQFLTVGNSGMTKSEAYEKIFYHAAKAIREVDHEANDGKVIPMGGPSDPNPKDTTMLRAILQNEQTRNYLDFASYHNYHMKEPSVGAYRDLLTEYKKEATPIFVTEWNYDGNNEIDGPYKTSDPAITYTADKLVDFFKMGITGANYYSLQAVKEKSVYLGFYRWVNNQAELLPQAKTWRLMSNKMMLGKGPSLVYDIDTGDSKLNAIGFKNSANQYGTVIVNNSSESQMITISLENLPFKRYAKVAIYNASAENDANTPIYEGEVKIKNTDMAVYVPKEAVVGLTLSEEKSWYDFLNLPY